MSQKKTKKSIIVIAVLIGIVALVWFVVLYPLIDFSKKESTVLDAAKDYYNRNNTLLPSEGEMSTVTLKTLLAQKYVGTLKSTYGSKYCNVNDSWVKVKRKGADYDYYVYLECGSMKSSVDHDGPVIKLKGKEEIEIEKGASYTDEGIDSVYDDTDGKMNKEDVIVENKVNTKKIGTYEVTYTASDSFENTTTVKRVVKVIQTLDKIVENDTDKDNFYKGDTVQNYISFSNILFRIVGVNSNGTVKIVSAEPVGTVNYNDINKWLNDYFYEHLTDKSKKYIEKSTYCSSKVSDDKIDTKSLCDKKNKDNVGILSIADYNKTISNNTTYLYPKDIAWTSDYNNNDNAWGVRNIFYEHPYNYMSFDKNYNFTVYPTVTLKKGIKIVSGTGTYSNPYKFTSEKKATTGDKINTRFSGEYVSYGGVKYRIIEVDNNKTKVVSVGVVNENLAISYDTSDKAKIYNPTQKGNIGYYIENSISKYIKKDIFTKQEIEVPIYSKEATYSGKKTTKKYKVTMSAPDMYELFSGASTDGVYSSYWLLNSSKEETRKYLVSNNNTIYYTLQPDSRSAGVRVRAFIDEDVTIMSGKGTYSNPYVLVK